MSTMPSRTIDPAVEAEVASMLHAGIDPNHAISLMRTLGLNKIECIKILHKHGATSLHDAKDIVHLSPAWADRLTSDDALHESAEAALDAILKKKQTAA